MRVLVQTLLLAALSGRGRGWSDDQGSGGSNGGVGWSQDAARVSIDYVHGPLRDAVRRFHGNASISDNFKVRKTNDAEEEQNHEIMNFDVCKSLEIIIFTLPPFLHFACLNKFSKYINLGSKSIVYIHI